MGKDIVERSGKTLSKMNLVIPGGVPGRGGASLRPEHALRSLLQDHGNNPRSLWASATRPTASTYAAFLILIFLSL